MVNGYAAKNMCSCVFVAGLDEAMVREIDLGFSFIGYASKKIDYERKRTSANLWGLAAREAIYRPGLGCVLINEVDEEVLSQQRFTPTFEQADSLVNWFDWIDTVEVITAEQSDRLDQVIATAFQNDPDKIINTRGVVVLYQGQLVGEGYANGLHENSRLLGWSMTKSLTSTMAGLLARDSLLDIEDLAPVSSWLGTNKENITYTNLLQMSSGLEFEEEYGSYSDANEMLWISDTMGLVTVDQPMEADPGEKWYYSSGTTNLLMLLMRDFFSDQDAYLDYLNQELFNRIGAYSMMIEPDAAGNLVGSSFGWGTARDWARVGQLYLNNGRWGDEQILPEEWVSFVRQPPADSRASNMYGAQFWLNKPHPELPEDTYYMGGFHGQRVFIIPSEELVVVRLGVTYNGNFNFDQFVNQIIEVIKN